MREYDIVIPGRHPGQRRVLAEARRENWLDAGRRWRKTSMLSSACVVDCSTRNIAGGDKPARWIFTAPIYKQVRIAWDEIEKCAQGQWKMHRAEMWMEVPWNGSRVWFFSLDNPDNARGYTADRVVIDEAADVNPDAWHKVLRPMLLSTHGVLWASGTPKGHNWFWREFRNAEERLRLDPNADCATWRVPSLGARIENGQLIREPHPYENPELVAGFTAEQSFEELKRIFSDGSTPEMAFRQEYLAEFIADNAGVFIGVDSAAYGVALVPPYFGPYVHPYEGCFSIGVDWGRYEDFTVITVLDAVTKRVVDWFRINQRSWESLVNAVVEIYNRWHQEGKAQVTVLVEHNSIGSPNYEQLSKKIPCTAWTATNATKAAIIESLQFDIEHRIVQYPRIQPLLNELTAFVSERLPSGMIRYAAPEGDHDDCVISLALANEGTKYRDQSADNHEFSMDLDTDEGAPASPGQELIDEYKASLLAARVKANGIDSIPFGARELLARHQPEE